MANTLVCIIDRCRLRAKTSPAPASLWLALSGLLLWMGCGGDPTGAPPPAPPPPPTADSADLLITLTAPAAAASRDEITYRVTVRNLGPAPAVGVAAALQLPASVAVTSISNGGTAVGGRIDWGGLPALASGATLELTATTAAPLIGPVSAAASGASATTDPVLGNNDGSAQGAIARTIISFDPVSTIPGEGQGDQFGWLIEVPGDIDGDLIDDFVVTAPSAFAGAGRAYVYSGASRTEIFRFSGQPNESLGFSVDGIGDVDGDGVPDLALGAPGQGPGRAYVISGATGSEIHRLDGEVAGDRFGASVGRLGDTDGDGRSDFLVTAPGHDDALQNSGRVYIVSGADGSILARHNSLAANSQFGASVGGIGDVDGDGIPDFGVGAPAAPGGGRIYVLSGADAELVYPSIVQAGGGGSRLGDFWLNSPGDLDGDGIPDIFASDILQSSAGAQAGRAFVFSGADGAVIHAIDGEAGGDNFGIGRGVPDLNGDAVGDIFVAAWLNDEGGQGAGKAYVYSGADAALVRTITSTTAGENFGFDAVVIGDVTGDGVADLLVSGGLSQTTPGLVYVIPGVAP